MQGRYQGRGKGNDAPGPGQYSADGNPIYRSAPAFKMGGKYSGKQG